MRLVFSTRVLGYLAYAVVLTAVILYVRFPAEMFRDYCERRLERLVPGSECTIEQVGYRFPLTAVLGTIKLSREVDGQPSDVMVDRLALAPEPLRPFRAFRLSGKMYSGVFQAELEIDKANKTFQLDQVRFKGLEAGEFANRIGLTERQMSGTIEFSGTYQGRSSEPANGSGKGVVQVSAGSMGLLQPLLSLTTIDFDSIAVNVTQQDGIIRLADGKLQGKVVSIDFGGEMRLASPLLNSNILLSGNMAVDNGYLQSHPRERQVVQRLLQRYQTPMLPFKVGGMLRRPLFRFST